MIHTDLTPEDLDSAATECLTRPSDSAWFHDALFTTHGCVFTWADRTDDSISESNYRVFRDEVESLGRDETEDEETDVILAGARHWAVGHVEHIFVRVYDADGGYTPAFVRAVELAHAIRDYPILSEDDWSDLDSEYDVREAEQWVVDNAIFDARRILRERAVDHFYAEGVIDAAGALDHETVLAAYWEARSEGTVERWSSDEYQGLDDFALALVQPYLFIEEGDEPEVPQPEWRCPGQMTLDTAV